MQSLTSDGSAVLEALHGLPFTPALPLSPNPNPNPNLNPNPYPNPNPNPNPNETLALTLTVTVTRSSTACLGAGRQRQLAKAELSPSPELDMGRLGTRDEYLCLLAGRPQRGDEPSIYNRRPTPDFSSPRADPLS